MPSEENESDQASKMDLASKGSGPSTSNASYFLKKSEQMPKWNTNHARVSPCEPISVGPGFQNNSTSAHKSASDFKRTEAAMSNGTIPCPLSSPRRFMATDNLTSATSSSSTNHHGWSGGSSCSDSVDSTSMPLRPHTGGDVRWDAISSASSKDSPLGLSNFRLLKRLGYGDIGSIYLVDLRGTNAFFAMIVMDKGSLASRNKLLRAQTERLIRTL